MNIKELSKFVWDNSECINFGSSNQWDSSIFKNKWAKSESPEFFNKWQNSTSGWYWFLVDMTYDEMHNVEKPSTLPDKGFHIRELTDGNREIFGDSLLCSSSDNMLVIYNGHADTVTGRIRSHFALNNNKTGAIGLHHYRSLSIKRWQVKFFSLPSIPLYLPPENYHRLEFLINSETGRGAVESAWRANYGWPVLCKT